MSGNIPEVANVIHFHYLEVKMEKKLWKKNLSDAFYDQCRNVFNIHPPPHPPALPRIELENNVMKQIEDRINERKKKKIETIILDVNVLIGLYGQ